MNKIKRYGTLIQNALLSPKVLDKMDVEKYVGKLREYVDRNVVYIVKCDVWSEGWLFEWLLEHYSELGFEKVFYAVHHKQIERDAPQYKQIKDNLGFEGYPDFVVLKDGQWKCLEVESFSSSYQIHPTGYSEYLLCYDKNKEYHKVKILTIAEYYGVQEVINLSELEQFLYLYDEEFRQEYRSLMFKGIREKVLAKETNVRN